MEEKALLVYKWILYNVNGYTEKDIEELDDEELLDEADEILEILEGYKTDYK